ncbi:MAG: hypothetical protein MK135_08120 [Polyangiaceae bacterium]|nr:hypothetical protein [Polyangiaceae bacterium]
MSGRRRWSLCSLLLYGVALCATIFRTEAARAESCVTLEPVKQALAARASGDVLVARDLLLKEEVNCADDPDFLMELAITLWWLEDPRLAMNKLQLAEPTVVEGWSVERQAGFFEIKGRVYLALGKLHLAESSMRKAVRLNPQEASHRAGLGTALRVDYRQKAARQAYTEALSIDPASVEAAEGLRQLKSDYRWLVQAFARAVTAGDGGNVGTGWSPGGELYANYKLTGRHDLFARITQQMPQFGDPGGPDTELPSTVLTRAEAGARYAYSPNLLLAASYQLTFSVEPTLHSILLESSYQLKPLVFLLAARPGVNAAGDFDILMMAGLQYYFRGDLWGMLQVFQHFAATPPERPTTYSTTVLATVAWDATARLNLRGGAGFGIYTSGWGYPAYASLNYRISERWSAGLGYEFFGGFYSRHQLSLDATVRF